MTAQWTTLAEIEGADRFDSRDVLDILEAECSTFGEGDFRLACAVAELADAGVSDWQYGAQFIREDTFEDYARELAEDIGAIDKDASWPNTHIDWEAAADALQQDYTSVTFLGHDYLVRA